MLGLRSGNVHRQVVDGSGAWREGGPEMSWRLVEGVPLPDAVGGHPALDFCNTRAGWGDPRPKEYLTGPEVLALWARENGLIQPGVDGAGSAGEHDALAHAVALRAALYACALHRGTPVDWDL